MVASYDGNILRFKISEDVPLNKYRGESTETLSQAPGSTTTTFYEQETPLKEKDVDTD
ncbi:MAG TPA: hypothetical protein VFG45_09290 [Candidatus Nitrosocosmicus sp.]|jgi:hypothetical protein|uniref:hypothetical protein n=1 Tax=Candidatus Nitrosocosmicus agrestis TaxID=2563600 RepID=UPI001331633C|nr:hypothetical protein [Candidatus Nitrosocosmicus sp. SS]HET6590345.1 hypothetical protein [Candidatus Nitrosocosmicus sp.]